MKTWGLRTKEIIEKRVQTAKLKQLVSAKKRSANQVGLALATIIAGLSILVGDIAQKTAIQSNAHSLVKADEENRRWNLANELLNQGYPAKCVSALLVDLSQANLQVTSTNTKCTVELGTDKSCEEMAEGETQLLVNLGFHRLETCQALTKKSEPENKVASAIDTK